MPNCVSARYHGFLVRLRLCPLGQLSNIVQASGPCCVLTDSKPCVTSCDKLCRGKFSASPRVYTLLSTVSRYEVTDRHVAGAAILPSDHSSRNAPECIEPNCQICSFVTQSMDSFFCNILDGSAKLPFTTRSAWLAIQPECSDLRRTCAYLRRGTRPLVRQLTSKTLNVISMLLL